MEGSFHADRDIKAIMVNTYGISVGIEKIGWKLYLVYISMLARH